MQQQRTFKCEKPYNINKCSHYDSNGNLHYFVNGKFFVTTEEELQILGSKMRVDKAVETVHKSSVTTLDIVEMFIHKDGIKDRASIAFLRGIIKENKKRLTELETCEQDINRSLDKKRKLSMDDRDTIKTIIVGIYVSPEKEKLISTIDKNKRILKMVENYGSDFNGSELDVERAKLVPITDFLPVNKAGFVSCPWHNERTKSCKYYKKDNRVHCFGCDNGGDVIDVIQKILNKDFKEAVRFLTK